VSQAQAVGFDAFALNIISMDSWSTDAIATLFQAAALIGFSLFFSFDMINLSDPSEFIWLIQQYASNPAYYHHDGQPFVSMCSFPLSWSIWIFSIRNCERSPKSSRQTLTIPRHVLWRNPQLWPGKCARWLAVRLQGCALCSGNRRLFRPFLFGFEHRPNGNFQHVPSRRWDF
jgi:hypothetical protein